MNAFCYPPAPAPSRPSLLPPPPRHPSLLFPPQGLLAAVRTLMTDDDCFDALPLHPPAPASASSLSQGLLHAVHGWLDSGTPEPLLLPPVNSYQRLLAYQVPCPARAFTEVVLLKCTNPSIPAIPSISVVVRGCKCTQAGHAPTAHQRLLPTVQGQGRTQDFCHVR